MRLLCSHTYDQTESKWKHLLILEQSVQSVPFSRGAIRTGKSWMNTGVFSDSKHGSLPFDQKESISCSCACRITWKALPHCVINIFSTAPFPAGNIFLIRLLWWRSLMMKVESFSLTEGNLLQRLEIKAFIKHSCCSVLMRTLWQSLWNVVQLYYCACMQPKVRGIKVNQMKEMHTIHIQSSHALMNHSDHNYNALCFIASLLL